MNNYPPGVYESDIDEQYYQDYLANDEAPPSIPIPKTGTTKEWWDNYDWIVGRCSGFPDCCIEFFINWWQPRVLNPEKLLNDEANQYRKVLSAFWRSHNLEYVPCPDCIQNENFIAIKKCAVDCACRQKLAEDV